MYSVPFPVSVIRTRMRQEFEQHRFVNKLPVVDVLLMQNNAEYQVSQLTAQAIAMGTTHPGAELEGNIEPISETVLLMGLQETMNFWKQTTHVMSYFKTENFRGDDRLPHNFMKGFLEASEFSTIP